MRQSRLRIKSLQKRNKLATILLFYVLLPLMAVSIGYIASNNYIIPHFVAYDKKADTAVLPANIEQKTENNTEEENEQSSIKTEDSALKTLEMDSFDFHCIQVGSFSAVENANAAVAALLEKNYGGYVWENNGYKVFAAAVVDRSDAEIMLPFIQNYDKAAFTVAIRIPGRKINYSSNDESSASILNNQNKKLLEIFKNLSAASVETISNQTSESSKNMESLKSSTLKSLNEIKEEITKQQPAVPLKEVYDAYNHMLDQIISTFDQTDMQSKSKISDALLKSLFLYYEVNGNS